MRFSSRSLLLVPAVLFAACQGPTAPDASGIPNGDAISLAQGGLSLNASGGGMFDAGVPVHFSFNANSAGGSAHGSLHFRTVLGGLAIEFKGTSPAWRSTTSTTECG